MSMQLGGYEDSDSSKSSSREEITVTSLGTKVGLDVNTLFKDEAVIVDDYTTAGKTYVGFSVPGSLTSAAVWKVKVLDETGNYLVIKWADGNSNYDNIWDNRVSLTYS